MGSGSCTECQCAPQQGLNFRPEPHGQGSLRPTVPNTLLSTRIAATDLTGAAVRRVSIAAGAVFIAIAFLPKVLARS